MLHSTLHHRLTHTPHLPRNITTLCNSTGCNSREWLARSRGIFLVLFFGNINMEQIKKRLTRGNLYICMTLSIKLCRPPKVRRTLCLMLACNSCYSLYNLLPVGFPCSSNLEGDCDSLITIGMICLHKCEIKGFGRHLIIFPSGRTTSAQVEKCLQQGWSHV